MMPGVGGWTGEEWVEGVARYAEDRERASSLGRRWVDPVDVYGAQEEDEGWHALWECTEARCRCGAVELVPWRPGHAHAKHVGALLRVQRVDCWQCGEVLDLRLQRRDREAEDEKARKARHQGDQLRWWEVPRRAEVQPRLRVVRRPRVARRRRVVRVKPRDADASVVQAKRRDGDARVTQRVVRAVVNITRRQEAIRRARAYKGGLRFKVGGVSEEWAVTRG